MTRDNDGWPDIHVANWAGTKRSLHLYAQMLGKIYEALTASRTRFFGRTGIQLW
jgi:hypothetical protein